MGYGNMKHINSRTIAEAVRFGIVGVGATVLHYLIYYMLMDVLPVSIAYALGYVLSFVCNFLATCYFTFHARPSWSRLLGMSGAHVVNFVLHLLLLNLFLWIGVPKALAPIPVYAIVIPINFLLVRYIFKRKS